MCYIIMNMVPINFKSNIMRVPGKFLGRALPRSYQNLHRLELCQQIMQPDTQIQERSLVKGIAMESCREFDMKTPIEMMGEISVTKPESNIIILTPIRLPLTLLETMGFMKTFLHTKL